MSNEIPDWKKTTPKSRAEIAKTLAEHHQHVNDPALVEEHMKEARSNCDSVFLEVEKEHEVGRQRTLDAAHVFHRNALENKLDKSVAIERISALIEWLEELGSKEAKFGSMNSKSYRMATVLRSLRGDVAIAGFNELRSQQKGV
jgi:hypothetical protein